jgi:hypothetical protein
MSKELSIVVQQVCGTKATDYYYSSKDEGPRQASLANYFKKFEERLITNEKTKLPKATRTLPTDDSASVVTTKTGSTNLKSPSLVNPRNKTLTIKNPLQIVKKCQERKAKSKKTTTSPATLPKNPDQQKCAPVFLHKERRKKVVATNCTKNQDQETYLEAMLPKISMESPNPEKEAIENLTRLLNFIFRTDKKGMILPWTDPAMSSIQLGSNVPQDRQSLEDYFEQFIVKQGKSTWLKFVLTHNVDVK